MLHTQLVRNLAQAFQRVRILPKHATGFIAHGVDQKVRMNMVCVKVCADEYLAVGPGSGCKLLCQIMRPLRCDVFVGMEGLGVVIKPDRAFFVMQFSGCQKFLIGGTRVAVLPAHEFNTAVFQRFCVLLCITGDFAQRRFALRFVAYVVYSCHLTAAPTLPAAECRCSFSPAHALRRQG